MVNNGAPAKRIHFLDELRGLAVFCMVFYHAFFIIGSMFGIGWAYSSLTSLSLSSRCLRGYLSPFAASHAACRGIISSEGCGCLPWLRASRS